MVSFYGHLSKDVSYEKIRKIINNIKRAIKLYQEKVKLILENLIYMVFFYGYLSKDVSYEKIKKVINNIKRAIKLYQENRSKYSDINKSIINNSNKIIKGMELIISLIDNDEFRIPGEYYAKPLNNLIYLG